MRLLHCLQRLWPTWLHWWLACLLLSLSHWPPWHCLPLRLRCPLLPWRCPMPPWPMRPHWWPACLLLSLSHWPPWHCLTLRLRCPLPPWRCPMQQ
jgi:hypothetical protein